MRCTPHTKVVAPLGGSRFIATKTVLKNLSGHRKVRYKGIAKNQGQLFSLFGLANLVFAKRSLLELQARGAP